MHTIVRVDRQDYRPLEWATLSCIGDGTRVATRPEPTRLRGVTTIVCVWSLVLFEFLADVIQCHAKQTR